MMLYSTRAEDFQAIKTLKEQGASLVDAIDTLLAQR
jgi:predicted nucleic acid-binding protein